MSSGLTTFSRAKTIHYRDFVLSTWELLKSDAKARKADRREPMERLYDMVTEAELLKDLSEEQINHRLTAWLAGTNGV